MQLIISVLILFILINCVLKLSFWRIWQAALFGAVCGAFVIATYPYAILQSKTQLADYLQNTTALQNMAVIIQYTDFSCNRRRGHKVVAGYHYRTYSGGFTFSYRFGTFFSRRVLHCNKSEQDIVLFIFNAYVDCINVTFAHSKYTKSHLRKFRINFL